MNALILSRALVVALATGAALTSRAQTYGNTTPFASLGSGSLNNALGVQVTVPQAIRLTSFGLYYGFEGGTYSPLQGSFAIYASDAITGLPSVLLASTDSVALEAGGKVDGLAFTSTPTLAIGTYWMMGLYGGVGKAATLRDRTATDSLVAYWSAPFEDGFAASAPDISTYTGTNFNYWLNGMAAPVPEPTTLGALALGGLAVLRRRARKV